MITLTTDFGDSAYVGAMRGAILSIHPGARVHDLTHAVPEHDVMAGAFALFSASPFFPEGAIHVAVVDPGVGTGRKGLAIGAGGHLFVGPDNGILVPAARRLGIEAIVELTEGKYFLEDVSRTFHGRDVFAPVAAHLELGVSVDDLGEPLELDDIVNIDFGDPFVKDGVWKCRVINVDKFGNVTTNMPAAMVLDEADFGAATLVETDMHRIPVRLHKTYGQASPGEALMTLGSAGFAELSVNLDSCAEKYTLAVGDEVRVQFLPQATRKRGDE